SGETLPPNWEIRYSKSRNNKPYYFNKLTNQSVWEHPSTIEPTSPTIDQVRVAHILAKITRSKEEAYQKINEYLQMIKENKVSFSSLASTESDCSSAKNGGDLGNFGRGQMQ
ncbi:hypothetical protein ROZALSC1DRAFT_31664, partial [Rozella allomycis CSF55]